MSKEHLEEPTHIPVCTPLSKLLKRRAARVKELEESEREWVLFQAQVNCINQKLEQQNKRYRDAIESMKSEINYALYSHKSKEVKKYYLENAVRYADEALERDCIHCNGKGFNGLDYCPQCNQMEEDDDN